METSLNDRRMVGRSRSAARLGFLAGTSSTVAAISLGGALAAVAGTIGPDARWLSALGRSIVRLGGVPQGVPFATAPSAGWHNVPVLAELVFHGLQSSLGDRGLLAAQIVATVVALVLTARDARRLGATDTGTAAILVLVLAAGLLSFAGIRAQLFSLALFPVLVVLLRSEQAAPSQRIWLLPALVALWSNLHGVVLVGLALALVYLFGERARSRPFESAGVAAASLVALCATPALAMTPRYYADAVGNEAARRGYGLWAPLSLHSGFDILLVAGALLAFAGFLRARPRPWQVFGAVLLAALTVHASRNGIWLLLFVAAPAASALRVTARPPAPLAHGVALAFAVAGVAGFVRGPLEIGASPQFVSEAIGAAHRGPILAEPAAAEQIAQAGGLVWISNPLDAFTRSDQRLYLDWLQGRAAGRQALRGHPIIVVTRGSPAEQQLSRDRRYSRRATDGRFRLYVSRSF